MSPIIRNQPVQRLIAHILALQFRSLYSRRIRRGVDLVRNLCPECLRLSGACLDELGAVRKITVVFNYGLVLTPLEVDATGAHFSLSFGRHIRRLLLGTLSSCVSYVADAKDIYIYIYVPQTVCCLAFAMRNHSRPKQAMWYCCKSFIPIASQTNTLIPILTASMCPHYSPRHPTVRTNPLASHSLHNSQTSTNSNAHCRRH
jgi:hypothetical protein